MAQLPLGPDPRTETLRRLQPLLVQRFGHMRRATAERRVPEWVLVQGVIGARTKSEISNAATDRLLQRYGSWEGVADAPIAQLQGELTTQTYPNIAAERLKSALTDLVARRGAADLSHLGGMATPDAMDWLEQLPGVGRKVAAGVMNASTLDRPVLVLDSHHRRILQRMGLVPAKADTARAYAAIMPVMPPEWQAADYDEHHLLMKKVGQTWCRPARPDCANCVAQSLCETGKRSG
ncbi:endonuclease III domain-containing protein [Stakelama pacifica]|uniref:Endonuclease-3 n=1 Tax=Stakelama pacifica TaxID=517720 RepID=A0A4R6FHL8_9SPHN|nr:endonuclease III [Stakelama pacifica]MAW99239.1 endonuclease III [Sphingomonas sp.]TDN80697.1 endonuclease-3 [Stakelama pacifica]GGO97405.1 endonuclease III [Stakelama pacifica]